MFVQVRLLNGYSQPLLYKVPQSLAQENLLGKIVQVPIRNRIDTALVVQVDARPPAGKPFAIKELAALEPFPEDPHYQLFIKQLSHYYQINQFHFIERIRQFLVTETKRKRTKVIPPRMTAPPVTLTHEQQTVVDFLTPHVVNPSYTPTLVHGVTGSGKTEVYKQLIIQAITCKKTVVLMLPEVTLAIQFERIMHQQLPEHITICGFHSGTSPQEKKYAWQRLLQQEPTLIIGVHIPILLPISNLGLIIIDEEHEVGYQEKKHPKIQSKEAAIWRAKINNIPILLGSATPSITSLYNVKTKQWHFFQLKHRFAGVLPTVQTVLLSDKKQRRNFWISQLLEDSIRERLAAREQIIIFINRRGYSFFVQCKECSFIFSCSSCSVSLTLHNNNILSCHYCGINMQQPPTCPQCKVGESNFLKKGIGTQQVVTILEKLFPQARIGRADMDTSSKKKLWQQTLRDFEGGNLDILVGTQTIAKGFHFPRVTLVGVLWADLNLNFPLFNASETTLQQLIQVAGRAGRASLRSNVIIQAMADHPIFNYLNEIDYIQFYDEEIKSRQMVAYPPCSRLAEIELKHTDETTIERESHLLAAALIARAKSNNYQVTVLGPAKPPVYKIKNTHTRKIYMKGLRIQEMIALHEGAKKAGSYASSIFFTPNPAN